MREFFFIYKCGRDFEYPPSSWQFDDLDNILLQPVNSHPYSFTILADSICNNFSEIYLLTLVKSATNNFIKRHAIRQTWGRKSYYGNWKLIFLLGYNEETQDQVVSESNLHGDIIQENFLDHYWNNSLKMEMAFTWIMKYCSNAKYSLFVDDDMFLNIPNALKYLHSVEEEKIQDLYSGYVHEQPRPVRFHFHKHYVSTQQYPFHCYPPFLSGCIIFLSQTVIKKIQKVMPYIARYHMDDVYIGIIAQKLGIIPTKLNDFIGIIHVGPRGRSFPCLIAEHGYTTVEMFQSALYASYSFCDTDTSGHY